MNVLRFDVNALTTHGIIVGKTGSGKTGGILTLIENAIANGTNVIVIDPKGDISNICNVKKDTHKYRIFTPGDGILGLGIENSVESSLFCLDEKLENNPATVYLSKLLELGIKQEQWPKFLVEPPESLNTVGDLRLGDFFPYKSRVSLARKLTTLNLSNKKWGKRSIELFQGVTVYNLCLLEEKDRQIFVNSLLSVIIKSMRAKGQKEMLDTLVVVDEASPYLPPSPYNPITKKNMHTLLSQGRAYGVGILLGTQNPNDLDYKMISNIEHWFIGSLRERDLKRDLLSELTNRGISKTHIMNLTKREFFYLGLSTYLFKFRDFRCDFKGPLTEHQCKAINIKNHYSTDVSFENESKESFELSFRLNEQFKHCTIGSANDAKNMASWLVSFDIELPSKEKEVHLKVQIGNKTQVLRKKLALDI